MLLLLALLMGVSATAPAQPEESPVEEDIDHDFGDFQLDIVRSLTLPALHILVLGFLHLSIYVPTGAAQGPTAGENFADQGTNDIYWSQMILFIFGQTFLSTIYLDVALLALRLCNA